MSELLVTKFQPRYRATLDRTLDEDGEILFTGDGKIVLREHDTIHNLHTVHKVCNLDELYAITPATWVGDPGELLTMVFQVGTVFYMWCGPDTGDPAQNWVILASAGTGITWEVLEGA